MIKTINDNPTLVDQIQFSILTPDANGCFLTDPYMVSTVTIYYIERDFSTGNVNTANVTKADSTLQTEYDAALALVCTTPTPENIEDLNTAKAKLDASVTINPIYFSNAVII